MPAKTFPCELALDVTLQTQGSAIERVVLKKGTKNTLRCQTNASPALAEKIFAWFEAYAQRKEPKVALPLKLATSSPFTQTILDEMRKIPLGKTSSYRTLATKAASPNAARAVGNVCHTNPLPLLIPCHRVVRTDGSLGGFAYGLPMKEALLNFEKN